MFDDAGQLGHGRRKTLTSVFLGKVENRAGNRESAEILLARFFRYSGGKIWSAGNSSGSGKKSMLWRHKPEDVPNLLSGSLLLLESEIGPASGGCLERRPPYIETSKMHWKCFEWIL